MKWNHSKAEAPNVNITQIQNDYIRKQTDKKAWSAEQNRKKRRRMGAILVAGAVFLVPLGSSTFTNLQEIQVMGREVATAKQEQTAVAEKNEDLKQQVELLKDKEYVAKLARSRYYLSKEGEIIFSFPEDNNSKAAQGEKGE